MVPDMELVPEATIEYSPNALFRGVKALMVAPRGVARGERYHPQMMAFLNG